VWALAPFLVQHTVAIMGGPTSNHAAIQSLIRTSSGASVYGPSLLLFGGACLQMNITPQHNSTSTWVGTPSTPDSTY
jgi:hypothetical protein